MVSPLPWSVTMLPGLARCLGDVVAGDGRAVTDAETWADNAKLIVLCMDALPRFVAFAKNRRDWLEAQTTQLPVTYREELAFWRGWLRQFDTLTAKERKVP